MFSKILLICFLIACAFYLEITYRFCLFILCQTASAPATPLVSKHRPAFTRSNTISKPYISNTLPSDAPKKRRAPLPPMPGSQSAPQDLAHIQERPASCVVKSLSVGETDKVRNFVLFCVFRMGQGAIYFSSYLSFSTSSTNKVTKLLICDKMNNMLLVTLALGRDYVQFCDAVKNKLCQF